MELTKRRFRFGERSRKLAVIVSDTGVFSVTIPKDVSDKLGIPDNKRKVADTVFDRLIKKVDSVGFAYGKAVSVVTKTIVVEVCERDFNAGVFEMSVASNGMDVDVYRWKRIESRLNGCFERGWSDFKFQESASYLPWSEELEEKVFQIQQTFDRYIDKLTEAEESLENGLTEKFVEDLYSWVVSKR